MKDMIGYCGLDCEKCDAYIATVNDDQALREKTAKLWAELNNAPILPEHINCEGCRMNGAKTVFCDSLCGIRKCALNKGVSTCGDCPDLETCPTVGAILENNPAALDNLKGRTFSAIHVKGKRIAIHPQYHHDTDEESGSKLEGKDRLLGQQCHQLRLFNRL